VRLRYKKTMRLGKLPAKLDVFGRVLPILGWLHSYESGWLRTDILAGLTLWGILVPEAIAYAVMARAPPQAGLYTLLGSLIVYAIFGTTRQAVSAPTSGSSIMMAAVVTPFLVTNSQELGELIVYPYALRTRKSAGLMTRKLSVTESQKTAQFFGTSTRRKCRTDRQKSL
jgi:MFS superfamily sulfate permease-like transporter